MHVKFECKKVDPCEGCACHFSHAERYTVDVADLLVYILQKEIQLETENCFFLVVSGGMLVLSVHACVSDCVPKNCEHASYKPLEEISPNLHT